MSRRVRESLGRRVGVFAVILIGRVKEGLRMKLPRYLSAVDWAGQRGKEDPRKNMGLEVNASPQSNTADAVLLWSGKGRALPSP